MDQRCHPLCGGTDIPDVLLRHSGGAAHLHGHPDDFLSHHVRPVPGTAWNSAWSQWMSKFLSLSLWGFVTYMCIYYIDFILLYNLQQDLIAYNHLLHGSVNSWEQIGALGLQGIGSNCMYAMGMLVGAYIIRFVPEVASWLIPGGVSSGAGSAAGGAVMGMSSMASGAAGAIAGAAVSGAVSIVKPSAGKNSK